MTIQQHIKHAAQQLAGVADDPIFEAELLLAYVIAKSRTYLHAYPEQVLTEQQQALFNVVLTRRCNNEPIPYITGTKEFWSLNFAVTPDTLIPRPETELLVATVLALFPDRNTHITLADLGTGSGAIAIAIAHECPAWRIIATDMSANALQIASNNAQQNAVNNISFYRGSWCTALPCVGFDVIVSNPPYIAHAEWDEFASGLRYEPLAALVSGIDGLDAIREIIHTARQYLRSGGYLLLEHGYLQGALVREIFSVEGYSDVHTLLDIQGQERVTLGRYIF